MLGGDSIGENSLASIEEDEDDVSPPTPLLIDPRFIVKNANFPRKPRGG